MFTVFVLAVLAQAARDPYPVAQDLANKAAALAGDVGITGTIVVTVPPHWRDAGIVDAQANIRGEVIAITISPILLEDMDPDAIRGVLAHELAHTRLPCGPRYRSEREHMACEIRADALAAQWVGKRTIIRGLCQLAASGWRWRYNTNVMPLYERIAALHERNSP